MPERFASFVGDLWDRDPSDLKGTFPTVAAAIEAVTRRTPDEWRGVGGVTTNWGCQYGMVVDLDAEEPGLVVWLAEAEASVEQRVSPNHWHVEIVP